MKWVLAGMHAPQMTPWHAPLGSICQWWPCACMPGVTLDDKYCKPVKQHEHNKTPACLWCSGLHINRCGIGWQQLETTHVMRDTQPPPHLHTCGISRQTCHITVIPHCNRQADSTTRERRKRERDGLIAIRIVPRRVIHQCTWRRELRSYTPENMSSNMNHRTRVLGGRTAVADEGSRRAQMDSSPNEATVNKLTFLDWLTVFCRDTRSERVLVHLCSHSSAP